VSYNDYVEAFHPANLEEGDGIAMEFGNLTMPGAFKG